jgi:hypothetical protein
MKTIPSISFAAFTITLSGCLSTDTGNLSRDRRNAVANVLLTKAAKVLGQVAVTTLANAAAQEMGGTKANWQHAASQAAWQQAPNIVTSQDLAEVLAAATLNHTPNTIAAAAAQLQAAQSAGVPTSLAVNAIASTISGTALAVAPSALP